MDEDHPLLSHQTQAVNELAKVFGTVYVITGILGKYTPPSNVKVFSSEWVQGNRALNALKFLRLAIHLLLNVKPSFVFSHMTDVQSCLIAPVTKILRIPHFLWYAHAHKSVWLQLAHHFIDGIITSTSGSCPIKGSKVQYIGQAVDPNEFPFHPKVKFTPSNFVHVGRLDPSKRIEILIETLVEFRISETNASLTLVGNPSTELAKNYSQGIKEKYAAYVKSGWLNFRSAIPRRAVPETLNEFDLFIHAYTGSLDKTLIEATLIGIPVATLNPEYQEQFGRWSTFENPTLMQEIVALASVSDEKLTQELLIRRKTCEEKHSTANWVNSLARILS
jgi:glycosyltransferase involved in cell wall biosynthesis